MTTIGSGPRPFSRLAQQLFNEPLCILPHKAEVIVCALQQRLGVIKLDGIDSTSLDARAMFDRAALAADAARDRASGKTFHVKDGVAVIPIDGTLVHKFGWLDPTSGMTGYDGIARKHRDAMRDPDVEAIWFDIDSPGGSVAGLFALAQQIAEATASEGGKPHYAYVNEMACSAAYALASVCDKVYGPEDAVVGSIGCVIVHSEMTGLLDKAGIEVTVIRAGERKMRGNQYEALDKTTLAKLQNAVDDTRERFARLVSMARDITFDEAMATEADWFDGRAAVELGLMDAVVTEAEAWSRLEEEIDHIKRKRRQA